MFPTFRNIYLLLIQHIQFSLKTTILSPFAKLLVSLGWSDWPGMLLGKWTISQRPWWKKNSWKRIFLIHIHMQIYVFLGHMAWNLLRIPCWCLVLFFFILAVTSVSTIGIAEMHPIIFLGISVYKIIQSFLITAGRYGLGHWCWRGNIIQSLMIDNYHHIEDSWWWDGSDHWVILAADD